MTSTGSHHGYEAICVANPLTEDCLKRKLVQKEATEEQIIIWSHFAILCMILEQEVGLVHTQKKNPDNF